MYSVARILLLVFCGTSRANGILWHESYWPTSTQPAGSWRWQWCASLLRFRWRSLAKGRRPSADCPILPTLGQACPGWVCAYSHQKTGPLGSCRKSSKRSGVGSKGVWGSSRNDNYKKNTWCQKLRTYIITFSLTDYNGTLWNSKKSWFSCFSGLVEMSRTSWNHYSWLWSHQITQIELRAMRVQLPELLIKSGK